MLHFNRKSIIKPEISKYITEQTNKWLQKYSNNPVSHLVNQKLVNQKTIDIDFPKNYLFVSLFAFLAGYNFCNIIKQ